MFMPIRPGSTGILFDIHESFFCRKINKLLNTTFSALCNPCLFIRTGVVCVVGCL